MHSTCHGTCHNRAIGTSMAPSWLTQTQTQTQTQTTTSQVLRSLNADAKIASDFLVFDTRTPTQSVVTDQLELAGQVQTARARLAGVLS